MISSHNYEALSYKFKNEDVNYKELAYYIKYSAFQGYALSQTLLGVLYQNNEGVFKNDLMSFLCTNLQPSKEKQWLNAFWVSFITAVISTN